MRELRDGVWHWQAPHPEWTPADHWPQEVSSYAIDDGTRLLLFDPLAVPVELLDLAAKREPVVVLSAPWHERDTKSLVGRFGMPVFVPPPDTADDLVRKYGITPDQAAGDSPDVAWLIAGDAGDFHLFAAGHRLPIGIEPFPGKEHNDLVLWCESVGAVLLGDTLVDFGRGMEVNRWLKGDVTREQVIEVLRPLLDLPVEIVLPTHGMPTDRIALECALS